MREELFFSVDIEADGPIPIEYSMLSFGAVAVTADGTVVGEYEATLDYLPGAKQDPDTMAWWGQSRHAKAWAAARKDTRPAEVVMPEFSAWVSKICGDRYTPVFVAYPAGFDFTFMHVYITKFAGKSPFSFQALDMKSFAMGLLPTTFHGTSKRNFPNEWTPPENPHTHVALEDAREQAHQFVSMLRTRDERFGRIAGTRVRDSQRPETD